MIAQAWAILKGLAARTWFRIAGYHRLVLYQTCTDESDRNKHNVLCSEGWEPRECCIIPIGVQKGVVGSEPKMVTQIIWSFRRECGEHWVKPTALVPLPLLMRRGRDAEAQATAM